MDKLKRICWDCSGQPVVKWEVKDAVKRREGHLLTIACSKCNKESQVFGWMVGCDCDTCKNEAVGAAK